MTPTITSTSAQRRRGFSVVLAIELWERFGFYGMQAVLTIFMVEQLHLTDHRVNMLLGASSALTYIMPVLGGIVGDKLIGARLAMLCGAFGLMLGYISLAILPQSITYLCVALSLISAGNGLFKPNAGNIVRGIYEDDKSSLDTIFTLYYMSVNVGSTISILLMPWLQNIFGARLAFSVCALGLFIGISYYLIKSKYLNDVFKKNVKNNIKNNVILIGGFIISSILCYFIINNEWIAEKGIILSIILIILLWSYIYFKSFKFERNRLIVGYLLSILGSFYYAYYQQSITSLTLYTMRDVSGDFKVFGKMLWHFTPGQFQSLNAIWILILSPILALSYQLLRKIRKDPSIGKKMLIGYGFLSCAFWLWWQFSLSAKEDVSPWVMVGGYGFMSMAELLTGGLGLAVVARYTPSRFGGVVSGSVYALWGVSMYVGSVIANFSEAPSQHITGSAVYAGLFRELCLSSAVICIVGTLMCCLGLFFFKKKG
ncbi:peptide MFS transporter [Neokomagataea anthophila]|uniref:Peptide MFS transporter n=1 Tax=Neokomagataea anthophila TaxID=2826925 RepID=A0ABS5E7D5_9PROT|nr:peptide MFS transporter [Neokomagataea anthophila]MBR0559809.1 peptide MFS transporter [Neokomagataea anthophila]